MSKLSSGRAEDLATTIILASNKDILLAPAMNVRMWTHKATQTNYKTLIGYGYKFIGPINGEMACGEYGEGKMSSPRQIFSEIKKYFNYRRVVKQKKISAVVTTGPTREYLDPVRYISNESSGQQGYEIAVALSRAGVKTTLIAGACTATDLKIINVTTANEMFNKVKQLLPTDIAICVAAVSDFKPKLKNKNKIKKDNNEFKSIAVEKNPDILEFLGKNNKHRPSLVIGFAAETEDVIKNSLNKLKNKNCDMIIANDVTKNDTGFNSNFNEVFLIDAKGVSEKITKNKKSYIASVLTKKILNKFLINDKNLN